MSSEGVEPPGEGDAGPSDAEAMAAIARDIIAGEGPAVVSARPQVPEPADEPVENVRRLFGLSDAEFARLFAITEGDAQAWQRDGVPADRRPAVDALQAAGVTIVGGLGAQGAHAWLRAGAPSSAELLTSGRLDELVARADESLDSPFT
ncbi:MAG: hypothetical protein QOC64_3145 [Solirubrobacteraceae bacterium]|nr:hypothetical protein [Solirubrobacteraceae bacterium]